MQVKTAASQGDSICHPADASLFHVALETTLSPLHKLVHFYLDSVPRWLKPNEKQQNGEPSRPRNYSVLGSQSRDNIFVI